MKPQHRLLVALVAGLVAAGAPARVARAQAAAISVTNIVAEPVPPNEPEVNQPITYDVAIDNEAGQVGTTGIGHLEVDFLLPSDVGTTAYYTQFEWQKLEAENGGTCSHDLDHTIDFHPRVAMCDWGNLPVGITHVRITILPTEPNPKFTSHAYATLTTMVNKCPVKLGAAALLQHPIVELPSPVGPPLIGEMPSKATGGQPIVISGKNLAGAVVTIGGVTAKVIGGADGLLLVEVPAKAAVGATKLEIATAHGTVSEPFEVLGPGADLQLFMNEILESDRTYARYDILVRNAGPAAAKNVTLAYNAVAQGVFLASGPFDCPMNPLAGRCHLDEIPAGSEVHELITFKPTFDTKFGFEALVHSDTADPDPISNGPLTLGTDLHAPIPYIADFTPAANPGASLLMSIDGLTHCCNAPTPTGLRPFAAGPSPSQISVTFGGIPAKITATTDSSITVIVPPGAKDGPIELNMPIGTIRSAKPFHVADGSSGTVTHFVPVVLSSSGANGSFFTTELTLTNRGPLAVKLSMTYTAAFGDGTGSAELTLAPSSQLVFADAIEALQALGVPLPESGNRGGTLAVTASGFATGDDVAVTARTTTAVGGGRAGLAYPGVSPLNALHGTSYLYGLRQNAKDRSNVALQNAGKSADGSILLRLTVFSGDPANPVSKVLPEVTLAPGAFTQISGILAGSGLSLTNGYVRVERVAGSAPYHAYAVINDQKSSDGSLVSPVLESAGTGASGLTVPAVVEAGPFTSELTATNRSASTKTLDLTWVASAIPSGSASISLTLLPGEQKILPGVADLLRNAGAAVGPKGPAYAGALFATVHGDDASGLFLGVRVSAAGPGGDYGVFYSAVPYGAASTSEAWVYGLRQDDENRSNLALVNTGEVDASRDVFTIQLYDGESQKLVATLEDVKLDARGWTQLGMILATHAPGTRQGWAHIVRTSGSNPFIVYGIVNDGKKPGERTGDGAYLVSAP